MTSEASTGERIAARTILRCSAPAILLAILCLSPFLRKAFTVDDVVFLTEAKQALRTPLTPSAADLCWDNVGYPRPIRSFGPTGLAMAYSMVPVVLLGNKEWIGHLLELVFFGVAIVATVSFALRLGADPRQATLAGIIFATFPVMLAMAGTLFPDVLAAMLGIIGFERLLAWKQEGRLTQALAAGLAWGMAAFARSHTLLFWPIGILLLLDTGDQLSWPSLRDSIRGTNLRRYTPLLIAAMIVVAITWITSGDAHLATTPFPGAPTADQIHLSRAPSNFFEFGLNWTLATPFAFAWLLLECLGGGMGGLLPLAIAIACGGLIKFLQPSSPILLDVGGLIGFLAILSAMLWALRTRRISRVALALMLFIALPLIINQHMPSKYLAPCAPAAAILLAFRISEPRRLQLWWTAVIAACGILLGIAILHADADFAGMARSAVAEFVAPETRAGHRAWYSGQWALTWYGEQAGAACLSIYPPFPQSGDVIIAGDIEDGPRLVKQLTEQANLKLRLLHSITSDTPGIRIMNPASNAGFYSNAFGYLPWRWSAEPINTYYIWEVD